MGLCVLVPLLVVQKLRHLFFNRVWLVAQSKSRWMPFDCSIGLIYQSLATFWEAWISYRFFGIISAMPPGCCNGSIKMNLVVKTAFKTANRTCWAAPIIRMSVLSLEND